MLTWERVDRSGRVAERIVRQIERQLGESGLVPGDQLPTEREMARMVGAGRASVREAYRLLQTRGRLEIRHGVGVFVIEPAPPALESLRGGNVDIDELFEMREVLEVPAATWAARVAREVDLVRLRGILDDLDSAFDADPADFRQLATLDASFHLGIADIASNRFLHSTSSLLHDLLISGMKTTLLIPGRRELSRRQHEAILAAIAGKDSPAAGQAARRHVRSAHRAARRRAAQTSGAGSGAAEDVIRIADRTSP